MSFKGSKKFAVEANVESRVKASLSKEWIYSGLYADVVDMALKQAVANGGLDKVHYVGCEPTSGSSRSSSSWPTANDGRRGRDVSCKLRFVDNPLTNGLYNSFR